MFERVFADGSLDTFSFVLCFPCRSICLSFSILVGWPRLLVVLLRLVLAWNACLVSLYLCSARPHRCMIGYFAASLSV